MSLPDVGDLCYVARVHCADSEELLFKIVRVQQLVNGPANCQFCGQPIMWAELAITDATGGFMRSWLRKFEPLPAEERISTKRVRLWDESETA